MKNRAFSLARRMFAAIAAAMTIADTAERQQRLRAIGPYRSRGKGRGTPSRRYGNACNNGGKGYAHQGPQERARKAHNLARGLRHPGTVKLSHERAWRGDDIH